MFKLSEDTGNEHHQPGKGCRGFTLTELILALGCISIVVLLAGRIVENSFSSIKKISQDLNKEEARFMVRTNFSCQETFAGGPCTVGNNFVTKKKNGTVLTASAGTDLQKNIKVRAKCMASNEMQFQYRYINVTPASWESLLIVPNLCPVFP